MGLSKWMDSTFFHPCRYPKIFRKPIPGTGLFFAFSSQEEKKLFQAADDKISAMHLGRPWGTAVVFLAYHLVI